MMMSNVMNQSALRTSWVIPSSRTGLELSRVVGSVRSQPRSVTRDPARPSPLHGSLKGECVLASFSPLSYPPRMTEPAPKLTLATPDDLADSLSFALRHEGRKSQHDSDK